VSVAGAAPTGATSEKASPLNRIDPAGSVTPSTTKSEGFAGSFGLLWRRLDVTVTLDERTLRDIRAMRRHPRIAFWLAACVIIYLVWQRCPTAISHAQFWAEDGWTWYPESYALGWRCLIIEHTGYLQTISRLVALLSRLWPLAAAPKVFAVAALLIQAAPAIFLLSPRMASAIPSLTVRVALALLLVAIPGMSEVYVNLTNAQWHLVLLAFLVLAAAPAVTWTQRGFDTLILLVSGLSGPFAPLLVPAALMWSWRRPGGWRLWRLGIIVVTGAVQLSLILLHPSSRGIGAYGIGLSVNRLINIINTDILGVATFGRQTLISNFWLVGGGEGWLSNGQALPAALSACIAIGALALTVIAFVRGPWVLRAFLIFVALEFVATLGDGVAPGEPVWVALENGVGARYFFHPIAAWLAIMMTLLCDRIPSLRVIGLAGLLVTVTTAIPADWELPKLSRSDFKQFKEEAKAFERARPGTVMIFPIRPMHLHDMTLVKH
jgi:hypothetical protein